jgi:hypothetical protein
MKSYVLPSEVDATNVVVAMARIIEQHGFITVGELHDLMGFSHTFLEERVGYRSSNHVLTPVDNGVKLEFPNPVSITDEGKKMGTIRLTMDFDDSEENQIQVTTFLANTALRPLSKSWAINRRPHTPVRGGRVSYNSPVGGWDRDDL